MKTLSKILIGTVIGIFCVNNGFAQKAERKQVREGNKLYESEKYTEAEIAYRKSLEVNPRSIEGTYNLGNALYHQEKYTEAAEQYQLITAQKERLLSENPANAERLAQVYHNIGNIGMKNKEYAKSVEAYKQSLRMNPKDNETRYNLALAQKLLEDQQQENEEQDQNNDDQQEEQEQEQNQDQQNEDKNQEQQQDEQQENKTQEEQQQNEQMSQDNAQQILDAFLQDEKETQEKVKQAQAKQQERRRTDKQW